MVAKHGTQQVDQTQPEIGMKRAVYGGRCGVLDQTMDHSGLPLRFGEAVAVDRGDRASTDAESRPVGMEQQTQVPLPEVAVPSIVVSPHHHYRQATPQPGQRSGDVEAPPRDHRGIGEPEIEQVAVDQQAIAQRRHRIEKLEEGLLGPGRSDAEMGIGYDDEAEAKHGAKDGVLPRPVQREAGLVAMTTSSPVSETLVRVNYSETDQMGVVYHARYLVWLDIARCDLLRNTGLTYRELELSGLRLAVSEVTIRYRQPARYDDLVRVRCWVRDLQSRRVQFGYAVEHAADQRLLATATTSLLALDRSMSLTRLPEQIRRALHPIPDPIKVT
jgi:acyl-CoA thioester hydrolase